MNNNFTVCLTHDVDRVHKGYQKFTRFISSLFNYDFEKTVYHLLSVFSKEDPYWNFEKIIEIEERNKVKSTFFFLNESMDHNFFKPNTWKLSLGRYSIQDINVRRYINWLDKNGWEIGLHGSYNSYKNYKMLKDEKLNLESIVGHDIIGIRQHYLKINHRTWGLQAKVGFIYDSSYGYTNRIGFRGEKLYPFYPLNHDRKFKVFPLAIMDFGIMKQNYRIKRIKELIDYAYENQAVLVVNWHQRVFNDKEFPDFIKKYEFLIAECKKRNANFKLLRELI
ncbi:MAG: polysaccharide deacetylase family protein [Candidatus Marinimicrobia bacterium]|nr:polysaccharide deacetylase family protein [Candidatus Neomarinimicrobiota bacterium]